MPFEKKDLINELFRFVALLENSGDFIFTPVGLTVKTYTVLSLISEGIDTSKELLAGTYGSKPNMTKKLKYLEVQKFISRKNDPKDRRIFHFELTQKSQRALSLIHPLYEEALSTIFGDISQQEIEVVTRVITCSSNTLGNLLSTKKHCNN